MKKPEPVERGAVVKDKELVAINRVSRALADLDDAARWRVLSYLTDKHKPAEKADPCV